MSSYCTLLKSELIGLSFAIPSVVRPPCVCCHACAPDTQAAAGRAEVAAMLNRAACRLKLGNPVGAVGDCDAVLEAEPDNAKALFRRGQGKVGGLMHQPCVGPRPFA
jgi:hypothetical protein